MSAIRVLLADDHALFRSGMRALLDGFEGVKVVAEAADGREAVRLTGEHRPDVVVMDITMPDLNGLDAAAQVSRQYPGVRVLVLSMHPDERSEEHTSELQSRPHLVCRLLLEKKKKRHLWEATCPEDS